MLKKINELDSGNINEIAREIDIEKKSERELYRYVYEKKENKARYYES